VGPFGEEFACLPTDNRRRLTRTQWLLVEGLSVLEHLRALEADGFHDPSEGRLAEHARRVEAEAQEAGREFHDTAASWLRCREAPVPIPPTVGRLLTCPLPTATAIAPHLALVLARRVLAGQREVGAVGIPPESDRWSLAWESAYEARRAASGVPQAATAAAGERPRPARPTADWCLLPGFRVRWDRAPVNLPPRLWRLLEVILADGSGCIPFTADALESLYRDKPNSDNRLRKDVSALTVKLLCIDWPASYRTKGACILTE
jgi:hypothetical protein